MRIGVWWPGDRAVLPAEWLRPPRSDVAGLCVGGARCDARGRCGRACHPDPGRQRHSPLGFCEAAEVRLRGHAEGCRARGFRARARHALRRHERAPGRARLPGLERAEPQPRSRPGQRERIPRDGERLRRCRARGRSVRISSSRARSTRSAIRRARSRSGTPLRRSPTCARCSASRRAHIRTRPVTTPSTSTSGRTTRTRSAARSGTPPTPTTSSSATCRRCGALLKAGVRLHHVVSTHPVKFWVTEFGWDSSPPRPPCRPDGPRCPLDGRVAAPDVALGRVPRHLVRPAGSARAPARTRVASTSTPRRWSRRGRSRFARPSGSRSSRTSDGSTVSVWGRDATSSKARVTSSSGTARAAAGAPSRTSAPNSHGIFRAKLKLDGDEDGLAARDRARLRQVASPSRSPFRTPRTSAPGATSRPRR